MNADAHAFAIRRAAHVDAAHLAGLFDAYRVFYGQRSDRDASATFLAERLEHGESEIFVAENEAGAPLGFTQLFPIFVTHVTPFGRGWLLNDLYVMEDARRRGVGRALLERAERLARETGAVAITLSTAIDNLRAQRLYESMQYRRDAQFFTYTRTL